MPVKRRKLQRLPHSQLTPQIVFAFEQCKKLATQCTCASNLADECKACTEWWEQQTIIHHALKLLPSFWPCLPDPSLDYVSPGARALYEELDAAIG
jgi:hypothetical protein